MANGYVLWEGPGPDRSPLVCIATGTASPSENPKTGPAVQVWLLRADMHPVEAVNTGADSSMCNKCPLRPSLARRARKKRRGFGGAIPQCYVKVNHAPAAIFRKYKRGDYPSLPPGGFADAFAGKVVRIGAYGNFSNAPAWLVPAIADAAAGWLLYEHNWRVARARLLQAYAMASVSSLGDKHDAVALGWRTFRVLQHGEVLEDDEILCPASKEGGMRVQCVRCRLCCGTSGRAKNIAIFDHGPSRPRKPTRLAAGEFGETNTPLVQVGSLLAV